MHPFDIIHCVKCFTIYLTFIAFFDLLENIHHIIYYQNTNNKYKLFNSRLQRYTFSNYTLIQYINTCNNATQIVSAIFVPLVLIPGTRRGC